MRVERLLEAIDKASGALAGVASAGVKPLRVLTGAIGQFDPSNRGAGLGAALLQKSAGSPCVTPVCQPGWMNRPAAPRHRTANWPACNAALRRRGSLEIWFDPDTAWFARPTGKRGRQPVFSDAAIQTCLMTRALFGLPPRQTSGLVESLVRLAGLDWPTPDFSTLCRRQKELAVAIACRPAKGALHLLVDSTGVKVAGDGEWSARKHGPSKPGQWREVHLAVDADTLEIRAIEVTSSSIGDAPMLPGLLGQTPDERLIDAVTAPSRRMQAFACRSMDGACDTRSCHAAIAARGAHAVIPPRRNEKPWKEKTPGADARNEALRANRLLGSAIWRRWSGYNRRSRVETKIHCFKSLGERIASRDFERQVAELDIRVAVLNRFTALGTPVTQRAA